MDASKKFWLVLIGLILGTAAIACSCGSIIPLATPTATAPPPPPPATLAPARPTPTTQIVPIGSNLPYYDVFSDPNSGWDIYNESFGSAGYEGGYYYITANTQSTPIGLFNENYSDTVIDIDGMPVSGPGDDNFEYGIVCRAQPNLDGYDFSVAADGYFAVYLVTDGGNTFTSLLQGDEYQYSSAINQGLANNHFTVTCNGSQLTFAVNGQVLFQGQDNTFSSGEIGVFTDVFDETTPDEIHFDDLVISAP
jgi:hypothetical protein